MEVRTGEASTASPSHYEEKPLQTLALRHRLFQKTKLQGMKWRRKSECSCKTGEAHLINPPEAGCFWALRSFFHSFLQKAIAVIKLDQLQQGPAPDTYQKRMCNPTAYTDRIHFTQSDRDCFDSLILRVEFLSKPFHDLGCSCYHVSAPSYFEHCVSYGVMRQRVPQIK